MNHNFVAELVAAFVQDFDHLIAHRGTVRKSLRQHRIFPAAHGDGYGIGSDHLAIEFQRLWRFRRGHWKIGAQRLSLRRDAAR